MSLENRIKALLKTGETLNKIASGDSCYNFPGYEKIYNHNQWFTEENVKFALQEWSQAFNSENITKWLKPYNIPERLNESIKLGIIMAGNIPLVGLHDFLCAYILGLNVRIKLSSKDTILMKWLIKLILEFDKDYKNKCQIFEEKISDINAVIATGSNNSNRYFEQYFASYPKILRHNRSSVAVLLGKESEKELSLLADDIFTYFGLGCRNVSKLYVPQEYDFEKLVRPFQKYANIINHNKYANNFNYQYTIIAMNRTLHINLHNVILIKNSSLHSPVSIINYEFYDNVKNLEKKLSLMDSEIQCIVSKDKYIKSSINFGHTQKPSLSDYADNIDTLNFLLNLPR